MRRSFRLVTGLLAWLALLGAEPPMAAEAEGPEGLLPAEAARHMTVPEGFQVQLVAGEPLVHQPIAFTFDARGRIWLAEAYTYPERAPEGEGRDRIVILSDRDRDGAFETRKVFAEGLNLVSGLELGFGGVWVGAPPYLLFLADRDGDDRPDGPPEVVLDGFGYHDTHETLNSFIWGPDGWLYGCHGVFTHSNVGAPGTPDSQRVPLNAGIWRYHPLKRKFEVFAWGTSNPWGVDFDRHGQAFCTACVIPHLYHVIQGARYERQAGSHFENWVYDDIKTIADHKHYAGDIRDHAWWGHEPTLPPDTSQAGGGHAHCGAMIYLADNWPQEYRNRIFMHNIHGNRINCDTLTPKGSGFVGSHAPDFLLANDPWFRGIALKYGPDGAVYNIDWYDRNACHRTTPEIWDRTNGRIYRTSYGSLPTVDPGLDELSDQQLVELHRHANQWYVRMARRLLQQRAAEADVDPRAVAALRQMVLNDSSIEGQLQALWTLHVIGQLDEALRLKVMEPQSDVYLQAWAIQLACEDGSPSAATLERIEQLATQSDSPIVRLYVASALQRLDLTHRWGIAQALVAHPEDANDPNIPLMVWYGVAPLAEAEPERMLDMVSAGAYDPLYRFAARSAASSAAGRQALLASLDYDDPQACLPVLREMRQVLQPLGSVEPPAGWDQAYSRLLAGQAEDSAVRQEVELISLIFGDRRILPRLRQQVVDAAEPIAKRRQALEALVQLRDPEAVETLVQVLDDPELQSEAVSALAVYDDPTIAASLVGRYSQMPAEIRPAIVQTLASRAPWARQLLDAIAREAIPRRDIHAYHVRQMIGLNDDALRQRIQEVWGRVGETTQEKAAAIADWKKRLAELGRPADPTHGRWLFDQHCAKCHRLFGQGSDIGPDLTGSNRTNLDYVLENMVAPSAVVGRDYQLTILTTVDGRVVQGIVTGQTESTITLQTLEQPVTVRVAEIDERTSSPLSMMPDGLLDPLSEHDVQDLVSYLASPTQLPMKGPRRESSPSEGMEWEAETLVTQDPSGGQLQSQAMGGFPADRWSGDRHLWWTGGKPGDSLDVEFSAPQSGPYALELILTRAPDYGAVELLLDGQPLGEQPVVDLYAPVVVTSGVLRFDALTLEAGKHTLTLRLVGKNPQAVPGYMVGVDVVRLVPLAE